MIKSCIFAVAVLCCSSMSGNDRVMRYDFGTSDSPLRNGYIRITPEGGQGAHWQGNAKRIARTNEILEIVNDIRREKQLPPTVYFSDLSCDHVEGCGDASLILDIPAGKYHIYAVTGHSGVPQTRDYIWNNTIGGVSINNRGPWEIRSIEFDAVADKNGLKIDFKTQNTWLVNFLLAVPQNQWEQFRKSPEFKELHNEHFLLRADRLKKWELIPPPIPVIHPEPKWSEDQKKQGFAVFSRRYCNPVFPKEFPSSEEINAPLRAFAARGEREIFTFSIHTLKDFRQVDIHVSELTDDKGNKLASPELRYVRYMFVRSPNYELTYRYYEAPDIVMPFRKPLEVERGRNQRFWLTVNIPKGTPAGIYRGKVNLMCDGKTTVLPLSLRVLPIDLQRNPNLVNSTFYYYSEAEVLTNDPFSKAWIHKKTESELSDLRDAGFTGISDVATAFRTIRSGKEFRVETQMYDRVARAAAPYGINQPVPANFGAEALYKAHTGKILRPHLIRLDMPPESYFKDFEAMVRYTLATYKKSPHWPEPIYYLTDEPVKEQRVVPYLKRLGEIVKKCGGRTLITADPSNPLWNPLYDVIDVWFPHEFTMTPDQIAAWQKKRPGTEFWCYPNGIAGSNDHVATLGARMTFGFGFWKSGFSRLMPWTYQWIHGDQWNYLDTPWMDFMNRTDDDGTIIPSANWICCREGVDDMSFIYTLQQTAAAAGKAGFAKEAAKAERVLDELKQAIPQLRHYNQLSDGIWDAETMDVWRWRLAIEIMELNILMERRNDK